MATSPTQLTLKKLRTDGWTCTIVEHWNSFAKIRQDLFGFGDILAIRRHSGPLIVQCTTKSNMQSRIKKIQGFGEITGIWTDFGNIEVWGWFKEKGKWSVAIHRI